MKQFHETVAGLQGVELGGQVIKRIIADLRADFPRMSQFASLSPVPGFRDWLLDEIGTYVRLRGQYILLNQSSASYTIDLHQLVSVPLVPLIRLHVSKNCASVIFRITP